MKNKGVIAMITMLIGGIGACVYCICKLSKKLADATNGYIGMKVHCESLYERYLSMLKDTPRNRIIDEFLVECHEDEMKKYTEWLNN